ncbi:MAG: InlB B-repeat-containing protein [Clostridiales bacterium]|nr:InlB B-repeat-containing protein [Clostridiales bacterium]
MTVYAADIDNAKSKLTAYLSNNPITADTDWNGFYKCLLSEGDNDGHLDELITALKGVATLPATWNGMENKYFTLIGAKVKLENFINESVPVGFQNILEILIKELTPEFEPDDDNIGEMFIDWLEFGDNSVKANNILPKLAFLDFLLIDSYYYGTSDGAGKESQWNIIELGTEAGKVDLNKIFALVSSLSGTTGLKDIELDKLSPALEEITKLIEKLEDRANKMDALGEATNSALLKAALAGTGADPDSYFDLDPFVLTFGAKILDGDTGTTFSDLAKTMLANGMGVKDISDVVTSLADSGMAGSISDLQSLAASYGLATEDAITIFGLLSKAGIDPSELLRLLNGTATWAQIKGVLSSLGIASTTLDALPSRLKSYFNNAITALQKYSTALEAGDVDVNYILTESAYVIAGIESFTLYVYDMLPQELKTADKVSKEDIENFFDDLLPAIKAEIKEQLEPWRTVPPRTREESYLYNNSTDPTVGEDGRVNAIDIETVWDNLGGSLEGVVNGKLNDFFGSTHSTIKATLQAIFGATFDFIFGLTTTDIEEFDIAKFVGKYLDDYAEADVSNLAIGVNNRTNQIWAAATEGNSNLTKDFVTSQLVMLITGIDALGIDENLAKVIAGAVIDERDPNNILTPLGDQIVAAVYKFLAKQVFDELGTNKEALINNATALKNSLAYIANYAEDKRNVEIEISGDKEKEVYIIGTDELSNNYDTFLYKTVDGNAGYYSALNKLGFTFSYELLKYGSTTYTPDTKFKIDATVGNDIEFKSTSDTSIYYEGGAGDNAPYEVTVAAYATLTYNRYTWKFLFATKDIKIVNAGTVTIKYESNYTGGPDAVTDTSVIGSNYVIWDSTNAKLNFTRAGYTFQGWSTTLGATVADSAYAAGATYNGTEPLTLYAIWKENEGSPVVANYQITFDPNGGSVSPTTLRTGADGKLATLPVPAARSGYNFVGWFTAVSGGTQITVDHVFTADTTLYAIWSAKSSTGITLPSTTRPTITIEPPTVTVTATPTPIRVYEVTTDSEISIAAPQIADQLYELKLFYGVGTDSNGKPIYALDSALNRLEALTLVIRLLGLEQSALAYTGANPFGDVPQWGDRIVAYAYAQGITVGVSDTKFDPASLVTQQQFSAFLLRVLGYYEKYGDFEYRDAVSKAVAVDLFTQSEANLFASKEYYLRAYAVINMCDELQTALKGSRTLLIDNLVAQGVLTRAQADNFLQAIAKIYYR